MDKFPFIYLIIKALILGCVLFTPLKLGYCMNTSFPFIVLLKCLLAKDFFQLYVKKIFFVWYYWARLCS